MDKIKNILTVIDPTKERQNSLERAISLAKRTGAEITAFMSIYDFSYEMTTMLSREEREAMRAAVIKDREVWLDDMINAFSDITINTKVVWHNRPYESIIEAVLEHDYDLVIKSTHEHDTFKIGDFHAYRLAFDPQVPSTSVIG